MAKQKVAGSGKRAKKEAARAAMVAAQRRERRRRRWFIGIVSGVVAVFLTAAIVVVATDSSRESDDGSVPRHPRLTAEGNTQSPPWTAPDDGRARVKAAGLPMLSEEGSALHIHAHLDVLVNGKKVDVPANIGIDAGSGGMSPLHLHDDSGVIHIESPVKAKFSLGQVFTEWDVALSSHHIGGIDVEDGKMLRAYVNGKAHRGNPASVILGAHDEIALVYGTAEQQRNPPASYAFDSGE